MILSWSPEEMVNRTGSTESDLTSEESLCFLVAWKPRSVVLDDRKHTGESIELLYIYCMQIKKRYTKQNAPTFHADQ